ncbi:LPXTG cell wall anchor domain-containing protein [Arthrobacter mangrovi]|nr:LPXTG cell wall anchor domain-containing protein [Arthrobacter mangrovi]
MKKTLTALAIAGSLAFMGTGAAQAAEYPAPPVQATVTDGNVGIGATILFQGSGFAPGSRIGILVSRIATAGPNASGVSIGAGGLSAGVTGVIAPAQATQEMSTTADGDGNFSHPVKFDQAGTYTLTATGVDADGNPISVSQEVVVGAAAGGSENGVGGGAPNAGPSAEDEAAVANGDSLANTGLESSALLWGGAGVLALGAGATALVVARRKNA